MTLPSDDIRAIRDKIDRREKAWAERKVLLKEREEIAQDLSYILQQIEAEEMLLHHKQAHSGDQNVVEDLKRQRKPLQRSKKDIDHKIDDMEDDLDVKIEDLKDQLIRAILHAFPDQHNEYIELCEKIEVTTTNVDHIHQIIDRCEKTIHYLQQSQHVRQKARSRGLLAWIFGSNPNAIVARYIEAANKEVEALRTYLTDNKAALHSNAQLSESTELMGKYVKEYDLDYGKEWSVRTFYQKLYGELEELKTLLEGLQKVEQSLDDAQETVRRAYQKWLDLYTRGRSKGS